MEGEVQDRQCTYNITLSRVSSLEKRSAFVAMANSTDFFSYPTICSTLFTDSSHRILLSNVIILLRNVIIYGCKSVMIAKV